MHSGAGGPPCNRLPLRQAVRLPACRSRADQLLARATRSAGLGEAAKDCGAAARWVPLPAGVLGPAADAGCARRRTVTPPPGAVHIPSPALWIAARVRGPNRPSAPPGS